MEAKFAILDMHRGIRNPRLFELIMPIHRKSVQFDIKIMPIFQIINAISANKSMQFQEIMSHALESRQFQCESRQIIRYSRQPST